MTRRAVHRGMALAGAIPAICALARPAAAHWCDDLWGSSYNITANPETDTVEVPSLAVAFLLGRGRRRALVGR